MYAYIFVCTTALLFVQKQYLYTPLKISSFFRCRPRERSLKGNVRNWLPTEPGTNSLENKLKNFEDMLALTYPKLFASL